MATITGTHTVDDYNQAVVFYEAMGNADTGTAKKMQRWADKWVQVTGTFAGATVTISVSNDGVTWVGATTDGTTACTFAAAGFKRIFENSVYVRASTAGGAGTDVDVTICGSA